MFFVPRAIGGGMHKSADIPRISVQTVQDWNLVKANVAQAMKKAVDDTQTDTKSKEALLAHLLDWHQRLFAMAAPNLRVDGQNFESFVEQPNITEFDEALDRRVSALREQSFVSDQTIADRRRMVPSQVRDLLTDLLQRQREAEVPIAEPDDVAMEDLAEPSFVAEHGRLEQQQGATQDLAKELNEAVPRLTQRAGWLQEAVAETPNMA